MLSETNKTTARQRAERQGVIMSNYTRTCVVKEVIEQSKFLRGKTISKILLLNKLYNDLIHGYEQRYLVVTYYTSKICGKIPYIYEAVFYEKDCDICFIPYKSDGVVAWESRVE